MYIRSLCFTHKAYFQKNRQKKYLCLQNMPQNVYILDCSHLQLVQESSSQVSPSLFEPTLGSRQTPHSDLGWQRPSNKTWKTGGDYKHHTITTHHVCVTIAGRCSAITGTGGLLAVQVTARSTLLEVLVLLTRGDGASQGPSPLHAKAFLETLAGKLSCPLANHLLGVFCPCTELPLTGRLIWTRVEQS